MRRWQPRRTAVSLPPRDSTTAGSVSSMDCRPWQRFQPAAQCPSPPILPIRQTAGRWLRRQDHVRPRRPTRHVDILVRPGLDALEQAQVEQHVD